MGLGFKVSGFSLTSTSLSPSVRPRDGGKGSSWSSLDTIRDALDRRGHDVNVFSYSPRDGDVVGHAESLAEFMMACCAASHAEDSEKRMAIVTHSFGGVVVRAALNSPAWR